MRMLIIVGGNNYMANKYNLKLTAHKDCVPFLENAATYASTFGLNIDEKLLLIIILTKTMMLFLEIPD